MKTGAGFKSDLPTSPEGKIEVLIKMGLDGSLKQKINWMACFSDF